MATGNRFLLLPVFDRYADFRIVQILKYLELVADGTDTEAAFRFSYHSGTIVDDVDNQLLVLQR